MKTKIKYNKRMSWAIAGEIIFGVLAIVGFFALGFTTKSVGNDSNALVAGVQKLMDQTLGFNKAWKLNDLHHGFNGVHPSWESNAYGLGLAGIIIAFIAVIIPLCSAFIYNKKVDRYLSFSALFLDIVCLTLLIASGSLVLYNLTLANNTTLKALPKTAVPTVIAVAAQYEALGKLDPSILQNKDVQAIIALAKGLQQYKITSIPALPNLMYKPGRAAGVYVLVFVGWACGWAGNAYSYWHDYTFGKFAK